jgi:hypothetical protein
VGHAERGKDVFLRKLSQRFSTRTVYDYGKQEHARNIAVCKTRVTLTRFSVSIVRV